MRRKKHRDSRYEACLDYALLSGQPHHHLGEFFEKTAPIHLEIGCGKGQFVLALSKKNPQINYIAVEKNLDVLILAMEKVKAEGLNNVKFLYGDVMTLSEFQAEGQIQRIYLNFSDPWKKNAQQKRRLTHKNYLALYRKLLVPDGQVHFKTDNRALFEFSLNSFSDFGLRLQNISLDLHGSPFTKENILTEYEELFLAEGKPIYRCEVLYSPLIAIEK